MEKTQSEDTLIFCGLTPEITKMSQIYEALEHFCKIKKKKDVSDRFNIILFQEDGPNYLEQFTLKPENILIALKSLEPVMVRANIAGGIMVAITFIIDVFKRIPEKTFRLIILTDKGSLKIPKKYIPVLNNLIDKVKDMPFFIDVVRLDIDDPREDLKLMRLARRANGDIHEINDPESLPAILEVLALKRELTYEIGAGDQELEISEDHQPFYENLADKPVIVPKAEETTCSICFQQEGLELAKCPRCNTVTHKSCWAKWAKNTQIGIFNVFRCHNCFNLLKLDGEYVYAIQTGKEPAIKGEEVKFLDVQKYLEDLETDEGPKIVHVSDPMTVPEEESEFEFEEDNEETDYRPLADEDVRIIWCPHCNTMTSNEYLKCPHCGGSLQDID
ncbi:MAG: hypothetical protein ACOC44_19535 [Promethearchaeia archaeon]